jgi:hypothetical protein
MVTAYAPLFSDRAPALYDTMAFIKANSIAGLESQAQ